MKSEEVALPWFPITPDYIDQYHDSVLKYIRDVQSDESLDLSADSSYITTVSLLFQRADQIAADVCGKELREMEQAPSKVLTKDIKILAAASYLCEDAQIQLRLRYMAVLVFLLSLLKKDISDTLVQLYIRFFCSERILKVGFTLDDVVEFEPLEFVKKLGNATFVTAPGERWYENHGTIRVEGENVSIFDLNRFFLGMKTKSGASFKPILSAEDGAVQVLQDKKDKHPFSINSFLNTVANTIPESPVEEKKKVYQEGDLLTVKVLNKGYENIFAESTDPAYETIALPVEIISSVASI